MLEGWRIVIGLAQKFSEKSFFQALPAGGGVD